MPMEMQWNEIQGCVRCQSVLPICHARGNADLINVVDKCVMLSDV